MAYFSWSNDLSVGNEFIDRDHRKLVDMVNALYNALSQGKANDMMGKVLNNLIVYTKEHFGREEAEMRRISYPQYGTHKAEHDKLIREVEQLRVKFDAGGNLNPVQVGAMLSDWLRNHIQKVDAQLAAALKK